MGAVAEEAAPRSGAQANLSALGAARDGGVLPDYVRMVAAGGRGFASALEEMTRVKVAARESGSLTSAFGRQGSPTSKAGGLGGLRFVGPSRRDKGARDPRVRGPRRERPVRGKPRRGRKTHLAVALGGIQANQARREVRFMDCAKLVETLRTPRRAASSRRGSGYYAHSGC